MFPGAGLLVLSAWCLGVLNSHRRFFLSYMAPVMWNVAMIAALIGSAARACSQSPAALAVLRLGDGGRRALQLGVQLPLVMRLLAALPAVAASAQRRRFGTVLRNFVPVVVSRGVVQLSAYIDQLLASLSRHRRRRRAGLRADALHAAGDALRHGGLRRRAARDVGRSSAARRSGARAAPAPRRRPAPSPSSSCRRWWPSSLLGDVVVAALPDRPLHARRHALRLGDPRRLDGGPARVHARRGSARRRSTRSATRARRCASPSSASCSPPSSDIFPPSRSRACWGLTRAGASPDSPFPPGFPAGWNFYCCGII